MKQRRKRGKYLILEVSEFSTPGLNGAYIAPSNTSDPQLSLDAFDKNQDMIRQANAKLNSIMGGIINSGTWTALRKAMMMDKQDLQAMKIIRILPNNSSDWDVFIEFIVDENDYWGVIRNISSKEPQFTSEIFKDTQNIHITKEWIIRITGIIMKTIKKFLTPEEGEWRSFKEITAIDTTTGEQKKLNSGTIINLHRCYDNKIIFSISNKYYQLTGESWIYFNWWFEKL